jgi:peptide/nickel transport system substrate-binding protein
MFEFRPTRCALLAPGLLILAAGCGHRPAAPAATSTVDGPRRGGQVVVALYQDIGSFNEYQSATESTQAEVIDLLFPSLMEEQPDYQLHPPSFAPRLATSWEFSADNRTLTFHLRPDARWSDGVPITADDVRFSYEVQKDPRVGWDGREIKDYITDVEVVDPHTVRFHFSRVYPYQMMDANDGHIVPEHAWGKIPLAEWRTTDFDRVLVTGAQFRLASHTRQQRIVLERDPLYWGKPRPYLDRLVFRILPDTASQLAQLAAGEIQVMEMVPPQDVDRLRRSSPDVEVVAFPSRNWLFIAWNNHRAPFTDRRVRRALSLATNRKAMVDAVYHGYARLSSGPVLSSMWAYNRNLQPLPYDPKRALELFDQAGLRRDAAGDMLKPDGHVFAFDLLYPATNSMREQLALMIQSDLAHVGVRVRPRPVEFTSFLARLESGDFDASISAWEEATKIDLTSTWSTASPSQGTNNFVGYSNAEVDRLIVQAREESDYTRAKVILDRAQELIADDQPVTFLFEADQLVAINRHIRGADINAAGVFFNVEEWYWAP